MTKTQKNSIHDTDIDEDALLALSNCSGTELDSEMCDRLLQSDYGMSKLKQIKHVASGKKSAHTTNVTKEILPGKQPTIATGSKPPLPQQRQQKCDFSINADDFKPAKEDVLDLQRMADKFAEMRKPKRIEQIIYEEVGGFNSTVVSRAGLRKMLEEAHTILYKHQGNLDRETRTNLQNLILKMMMVLPHLQNSNRVKDWVNQHTSHPEPEMCGFTTLDPFQPRKFVTDIQPRLSTTETNVVLGKRKRGCGHVEEDGDDIDNTRNSSDTRIEVHADWSRPCRTSKRRKVKK